MHKPKVEIDKTRPSIILIYINYILNTAEKLHHKALVNCCSWNVCLQISVFFVLLACVRLRKLQGVAISASEEGGPGPGLPDTGEQEKQPALIPTQTHVQIHTTL